MTPGFRAVCERLARVHPLDVLAELLHAEAVGEDENFFHCCNSHRPEHAPGCLLDKLLTSVGLHTAESREEFRRSIPVNR